VSLTWPAARSLAAASSSARTSVSRLLRGRGFRGVLVTPDIEDSEGCLGRDERWRTPPEHFSPEERERWTVRQVAPELIAELGEAYGQLWQLLVGRHGTAEAARLLSRIVGAIVDRGEAQVAAVLSRALAQQSFDLLGLQAPAPVTPQSIEVPSALATYAVETARATDYDWLLLEGSQS